MEQINDLAAIPASCKGGVIVIGNFDGVHKGHMALLDQAKAIAAQQNVPCGVLTFEPHPRHLFRADQPPERITPPALKAERLAETGIDFLVSIPFDWDFASRSYSDFIDYVLKQSLGAAHVVVGYNFRFGQLRKGSPEHIQAAGIPVTTLDKVTQTNGAEISSSAVRQSLRHGNIARANAVLGWDWEIRGAVVKGDQRGRELGYPTANVHLDETIHPAYGIYAAYVQVEGDDIWHKSAVNIGIRPMFEVPVAQVEAHILDFDRDIYGKTLRVRPVKRLRGEAKFDSLEALIKQIDADCALAREVLG